MDNRTVADTVRAVYNRFTAHPKLVICCCPPTHLNTIEEQASHALTQNLFLKVSIFMPCVLQVKFNFPCILSVLLISVEPPTCVM